MAAEKIAEMIPFEKFGLFDEESIKPSQALSLANENNDRVVEDFIDRYFEETIENAAKLKTQRARENRYSKARESILTYGGKHLSHQLTQYVLNYRFVDFR